MGLAPVQTKHAYLSKYYSPTIADGKIFILAFLRLVNNCVESIYKT